MVDGFPLTRNINDRSFMMKLLCISLGCDKNLVDTEMMLGLLNKDGYTLPMMNMRRT